MRAERHSSAPGVIMSGLRRFLCLSLMALLAGPASGATVTLFGSDDLAPKCWNENGKPRGYAIDAAVEALRRAGYEVDVKLEPWIRAVEDAKAGRGFITHFSKTPERALLFDFSRPLVYDRIVVVVRKGHEFPFAAVKDLVGKRVGVLRGVAYGGDWSAAAPGFTLEEDTDAAARIGKLMRGRLDAAVISSGAAGLEIAAERDGFDPAQFSILPVPILDDPNYLALAKSADSAAIIARLDVVIAQMQLDGTVDRIMAGYGDQR
jgi:polar amino acid transport system substrate-binding protein